MVWINVRRYLISALLLLIVLPYIVGFAVTYAQSEGENGVVVSINDLLTHKLKVDAWHARYQGKAVNIGLVVPIKPLQDSDKLTCEAGCVQDLSTSAQELLTSTSRDMEYKFEVEMRAQISSMINVIQALAPQETSFITNFQLCPPMTNSTTPLKSFWMSKSTSCLISPSQFFGPRLR